MKRLFIALSLSLATIGSTLRAEVAIQDITTPGGIQAWLVEEHSIPFTALEIIKHFFGGRSFASAASR